MSTTNPVLMTSGKITVTAVPEERAKAMTGEHWRHPRGRWSPLLEFLATDIQPGHGHRMDGFESEKQALSFRNSAYDYLGEAWGFNKDGRRITFHRCHIEKVEDGTYSVEVYRLIRDSLATDALRDAVREAQAA